jgi:uncharacterized membrane protein YtjA (UPF0391 family)
MRFLPCFVLGVEIMLRIAGAFLLVAILAALFGFGLIEDFTFSAAKILFAVFLVLAVSAFITDTVQAGRPLDPI